MFTGERREEEGIGRDGEIKRERECVWRKERRVEEINRVIMGEGRESLFV